MRIASAKENILIQLISWHFFEMPKSILMGWRNFLLFCLNFFSVSFLLKTLFSPWRKYKISYKKGLNVGKNLEVFISNLIFRALGALLRICLIFVGLLFEALILIFGFIAFFAWLLLTFLLIGGFMFAIDILV